MNLYNPEDKSTKPTNLPKHHLPLLLLLPNQLLIMLPVQILLVLSSLTLFFLSVFFFSLPSFLSVYHHRVSSVSGYRASFVLAFRASCSSTYKVSSTCDHLLHYCGDTAFNLKYPFRFEGDPSSCGADEMEVSCRHNRTILHLQDPSLQGYFYVDVDSIDYENGTFHLTDPGVQKNDCSTLPLYPFNYSYPLSVKTKNLYIYFTRIVLLVFVSCKRPTNSSIRPWRMGYIGTVPCNISAKQFSNHRNSHNYVVIGQDLDVSDIEKSCTIIKTFPIQIEEKYFPTSNWNMSFQDIHNRLAEGFQLSWVHLPKQSPFCVPAFTAVALYGVVIAGRDVIGILLLIAFLIYKWRRRHLSMYETVEEFLQGNNGLMPIRYSYREIKAMTNNFKEKLGEGGYGLVYKGKLRSRNFVAVKMLNKARANGQEFINEIASIGRIHHVNVVRLVGFCVTSTKHALVYDYMPNGSLEKFINSNSLSWKKAYEIAMGVARGIAYLHQGCDMQILHFDIKPHNILLDENFVPKISDFGLAKLYPVQDGYVATLTAIRGTLGYMAPELFYKKIGRVSNKADVYSFGMLLMDMAGRWRNIDVRADHSSQIYFTSCVYDKLAQGEDIDIGDHLTDEENAIAKKLILIALWCIQMTPTDRPSMREVIEMLQGDLEGLQLPPKPLFYPPDSPRHMQSCPSSSEESTEPLCRSIALEIEQMDD